MTLLSVVRDVCATVGVLLPQSVFSGITGNRTMQEMVSVANEMAQRICYDSRDWTKLRQTVTYTGDGVTTAFNFPANYQRMLLTTNVWRSTSTQQPMRFIADTDEWLVRRADPAATDTAWGEWTFLGGQIHIFPVMAVGVTAFHGYLDKNCIELRAPNGDLNGYGDRFLADADTFRLDERLLKLGMISQWKASKGQPYAEDMGTWADAMTSAMGRDSPSPILIDRLPIHSTRHTYPWQISS